MVVLRLAFDKAGLRSLIVCEDYKMPAFQEILEQVKPNSYRKSFGLKNYGVLVISPDGGCEGLWHFFAEETQALPLFIEQETTQAGMSIGAEGRIYIHVQSFKEVHINHPGSVGFQEFLQHSKGCFQLWCKSFETSADMHV